MRGARGRTSLAAALLLVVLLVCCLVGGVLGKAGANFYEVLGVSRRATDQDIKKAYRAEAVKWHPDKHRAQDKAAAEERFKLVGEAYNTLKDARSRAAYDARLRQGFAAPPPPGAAAGGPWGARRTPSYGFQQTPGGYTATGWGGTKFRFDQGEQMQFPKPPQWRTLRVTVECTLEELCRGVDKEVRFKQGVWERYKQAAKTGLWLDIAAQAMMVTLPSLVRLPLVVSMGFFGAMFHNLMPELPQKTFPVPVPPGCADGAHIRLSQEPEIFAEVVELPHKVFERRGDDLLIRHRISGKRLAAGGDVRVPTLGGGDVTVHLKKGEARDGYIKAVSGLGMPLRGGAARGKLLVMFIASR